MGYIGIILSSAAILHASEAAASVQTVRLRNGVEMPFLAAGVWQYNDSQAEASVAAALKVGVKMVDTAYDYQNQVGVGQAIRKSGIPRSSLFIETKVPGCGLDPAVSTSHCYNDTKNVLQENLELLKVTYVDLVIVHFPPRLTFLTRTCRRVCNQVQDQWRAMEEFYLAGKARAIGVSNYCPSCFACLDGKAQVYPMVNQISYHIGMGPNPSSFVTFAEQHGVVLQAYSPLGNLPWTKRANPIILKGDFTSTLAKAHGKSTIQIALKWLVQHGVAVVTKSSNPTHLAEDNDLWSWNMTSSEMAAADKYRLFGIPSFACNFDEHELVVV